MSFVWQPITVPSSAATPSDADGTNWVVTMARAAAVAATAAALAMSSQAIAANVRNTRFDELPNVTAVADDTGTPWPPPFLRIVAQAPVRVPPWIGTSDFVASTATPARGPATVALLRLEPEQGATVTYSWQTDVQTTRAELESRIARRMTPRESYAFSALLSDNDVQTLQSALIANLARGAAFAVALEHEALLVTGCAGAVVSVPTLTYSDWTEAGQTCVVVAPDGVTTRTAVVQSTLGGVITLDTDVSAAALPGALIMPTVPSLLDSSQGLALYPVNLSTYQLRARAAYFGNASGLWVPHGASVTSYTDALAVTYPVWDRGLEMPSATSPRALIVAAAMSDFGGALLLQPSTQVVADIIREIVFTFTTDADRQLLKAFHGTLQGKQKVFLLPTWKPDFTPLSDASTSTLLVSSRTDYAAQWSQSLAHTHLQLLKTDGTVAYRTITDKVDNHDGTQTLQLDSALVGALARVSFLEQCRLDSDDIIVTYSAGCIGTTRIPCRVVQR